jgi:hypothetical protein
MDNQNNTVGQQLAKQTGDCGDLCDDALKNNKLKVLVP